MSRSLTEVLDNLYTSTWQNMKDTTADQIFDSMPFWYWLKDKGRMETVEGGRYLTEPLQFDKSDSIKWIGKGGVATTNDFEFLTTAKYDWRYLIGSIVRFGVDDQQNRGRNQIINLMTSKMDNVKNSITDELETRLAGAAGTQGSGTATDAAAMDGLQWLVADDPTAAANTVGGIDPSVYTWWQNKTATMSGLSFATYGVGKMRTILNNASNNLKQDSPDIIVTGQTPFEYYEDTVLPHFRVNNNKLGDLGFENIQFKGRPMIWSPSIGTRMYMLNTRYIKFAYDPMMFFDMTAWKDIPNQVNDRTAQIITACSFKTSRRRCQAVIHTIDTA